MNATQELRNEHGAVLVGLKALDKIVAAIEAGSEQALGDLEQLLEFFRGFVDVCHHGKEEDVLFPELEKRGVDSHNSLIDTLREEHEVGREQVRAISAGLERLRQGDRSALTSIREHADAYGAMLRDHIRKEGNALFPLANQLIPEDALNGKFEQIERERVGEGKHDAYHALLHDLKDRYGVA
jgi:hemerythrin-like domain-containing protein